MEFGLYTFVENTPVAGKPAISDEKRLQHLLEEARLADELGLDVFAVGEHHREEYISSAPSVILSAIAAQTQQIRLSSAVTVLGSEDPVRVFQQYSTLDLLSQGRAEIMVGRGSFIESFPLFGQDLQDYEEIFREKLELLLQLREQTYITWKGKYRPPIRNRPVYPRPVQQSVPVWRAVGGTPQSAHEAGALGLPMALAIIGGKPEQFRPMVQVYRNAARDNGYADLPLSINSHGFLAEDPQKARDIAYPAFKVTMDKIGKERGWPPMSRSQFDISTSKEGANAVGNPEELIEKILYQHELFGHNRYLLQMSVGSVPHEDMLRSIELFAREVVPAVRSRLKK